MAFPKRWLLILLALTLAGGPGLAASISKEQRAFNEGLNAFHDGMWSLAEMDFDQFAQKFPNSTNLPEVGLLQAQALIKQVKFPQAEALLAARKPVAGNLADAYAYWTGEAQFQTGDLRLAAATLATVPKNSSYALRAAVVGAAALAKLGDWPGLVTFLGAEAEVLQTAERSDPDNELVMRGRLLLAQAQFAQGDFRAASTQLAAIKPAKLPTDLAWQRLFLLCQVKLSDGEREAALPLATELLKLARLAPGANGGTNLAASVALQATVLEELGQSLEAIEAFRENLATNAPEERQRQAILKIAELSMVLQQFTNAETVLADYVTQFTNSPANDVALLTLGELYLHDFATQPVMVNLLVAARTRFDQMLAMFPNSSFGGQAYLNRGWCNWLEGKSVESLADFQSAILKLPHSEDLAVAQFKVGDALFARADYANALAHYQTVLTDFGDLPKVAQSLGDLALYQSLRAQLQLSELSGAAITMARITTNYPAGELSETSALLLGEGYTDLRQPTNALAIFQSFKEKAPQSPLQPSVDLAIARVYEEEQNWPAARSQYDKWLASYPTNELLPQALYSQAWANYQAGNETNALMLFTNFIVRYPLHELAPTAQMWVADHYFRLGESVDAERNYKAIFQNTNWQNSALFYPAQMMAGRAAISRTDNAEAIRDYFQKLEEDTNCPVDLRIQATFAHGSALMKMESSDTNNPGTNFLRAITVLNGICTSFPTNEVGARAWGEMGDCYLQLSRLDDAANAFAQALKSSQSSLNVHSQAQIGLGLVQEKRAAQLAGPDQAALLTQALGNYLAVFYEDEPEQDPFWKKKAGLQAADLVVALGQWQQATNIYGKLIQLMPQLKPALERKMEAANQHLSGPAL